MQKLCRIHLAMLIHRDRRVRVRIRISVRVQVNSVQIMAQYSHSSRKTNPNPNTGLQFTVRQSANPQVSILPMPATRGYMQRSSMLSAACSRFYAVCVDRPIAQITHNISTMIPSSRRPVRINPTSTRHEQHAGARFTTLRLNDHFDDCM